MRYRKRPRWVPDEPKATCASINTMQSKLRERADALEAEAAALRILATELETVRDENVNVRSWGEDIIDEATSQIDTLESELADAKQRA